MIVHSRSYAGSRAVGSRQKKPVFSPSRHLGTGRASIPGLQPANPGLAIVQIAPFLTARWRSQAMGWPFTLVPTTILETSRDPRRGLMKEETPIGRFYNRMRSNDFQREFLKRSAANFGGLAEAGWPQNKKPGRRRIGGPGGDFSGNGRGSEFQAIKDGAIGGIDRPGSGIGGGRAGHVNPVGAQADSQGVSLRLKGPANVIGGPGQRQDAAGYRVGDIGAGLGGNQIKGGVTEGIQVVEL